VRAVADSPDNIPLLGAELKTAGSFLSEARASKHISSGDLYSLAMQSLKLPATDTAILREHCGKDSYTLINTLLSYLKPDWGGQEWEEKMSYDGGYTTSTCRDKPHPVHRDKLIDLIQAYMLQIIRSTALPTARKVALLRGQELGKNGSLLSSSSSVIDSLFADKSVVVLGGYMLEILQSTLSNEEKFAVLRLDRPDRTDREDMNDAHHCYRDRIRYSNLPKATQDALLKNVLTKFDQYCTLI
jgi:hypothetical protein